MLKTHGSIYNTNMYIVSPSVVPVRIVLVTICCAVYNKGFFDHAALFINVEVVATSLW
jgi:hypothetical protein